MKYPDDISGFLAKRAKTMAEDLLRDEHRGPGDTIQAAASRLQVAEGLDENILMQCWNRPPREMLVSRWMTLFFVHHRRCAQDMDNAYERKRAQLVEDHPVWVGLADLVAGRAPEPQISQED